MSTAAGRPAWFLVNCDGYIGEHLNESTATGSTREGLSIKASFFPNRPPQPSKLYVHSADAGGVRVQNVRVVCIAGELILFRVVIGPLPFGRSVSLRQCDYFVYRFGPPDRLSLTLLPKLPATRYFQDFQVGILPRGDEYTIAALLRAPPRRDKFELLLIHSETNTWSFTVVPVVAPQREFPVKIPTNATYLFRHFTTNVITLGGEHGTMGWVDLWRGILLCDVLRENPTLRGVPLPLPMKHITGNDGMGWDFGRARDCRGIAFIKDRLKFVELDLNASEFTKIIDEETNWPSRKVHDWAITTWTNYKMSDSYEDWHKDDDCTVQASNIAMNSHSAGNDTSLVLPSQEGHGETTAAERASLQNLVVSDPFPSMDGDDVVYLLARVKLRHPKAWILALDMRKNTLQAVAPFGIQEYPGARVMYCTS